MNNVKRILSLTLALLLLIALSACTVRDTGTKASHLTFSDSLGNEVVLSDSPKKVAVLFSSFAEVWTLAGGDVDVTVGESIERGFVSDDTTLVDAGAGKTIDIEALIASSPDFVICSADIEAQLSAAEILKESEIPVACFRTETFDEYLNMLDICTKITNRRDLYAKNGTDVKARIDKLLASFDNKEYKNILFIRAGSSSSSTKAKTSSQHFAASMLSELGLHNIADDAPILLDGLSIEEIITRNPDFIFISTMGNEAAAQKNMDELLTSPEWQSLDAVRDGRYVYLPKSLFHFKPNSRWDEAYEFLIDFVYES